MNARAFPVAVLVLAGAASAVSAQGEHLVVPASALSDYGFSVEYDMAVRKTLLRGGNDTPYLRFIAQPAFDLEWMVEVSEPVAGQSQVRVVTARSPIWNSGAKPHAPGSSAVHGSIPAALATRLKDCWVGMLHKVRYPDAPTLGFDGATYHFVSFVVGEGNLVGKTWSPPAGSSAGDLVILAYKLRTLVVSPEAERAKALGELETAAARFVIP